MKQRIRITTPGIYGLVPTEENPTGEYPIGHEFDTDATLPEGWNGKYHIVSRNVAEGSVVVTNPSSTDTGPLDGSVDDLVKHITGITDPDEIEKLIKAETDGKARKGAIAALEARRDELLAA